VFDLATVFQGGQQPSTPLWISLSAKLVRRLVRRAESAFVHPETRLLPMELADPRGASSYRRVGLGAFLTVWMPTASARGSATTGAQPH
jgi:hypothetical protein